jgi:predicted transposase YbfD/YdcC
MDSAQYTSLAAALSAVPDPRHARGCRYPWSILLLLIALALLCDQKHLHAIAQWTHLHAPEILPHLPRALPRLPSRATFYRVLQQIDLDALEGHLAAYAAQLCPRAPAPLPAVAVDGKWVRGAGAHGVPTLLVSLVAHQQGLVVAEAAAAPGEGEPAVVARLLTPALVGGRVVTADALHTDPRVAAQICAAGGHYLLPVKANQPELQADIALLFAEPPWGERPTSSDYQTVTTVSKGHGRLETRCLEASAALNEYLDWPQVGQVLRRTCERVTCRTGEVTTQVSYGITSLGPQAASAAQLEQLWRGHWTIENRVHYVRDETWREDRGQVWRGHTPAALAALRNGVLNGLRAQGHQRVAEALRAYAAAIPQALRLLLQP